MTQQQDRQIEYLKSEVKKLEKINTERYNQICELKKELKRYMELYINNIK